MENKTYLFIDGGYVRKVHLEAMNKVFHATGRIAIQTIKDRASAFRVFYYDCLDDEQRSDESAEEFGERFKSDEDYFDAIGSVSGVHLCLGTIVGSGKRKKRQKEVDVSLAVDMLTHAFNHNMNRAVLVTGDLDFRPLVEAVVRSGVFVEVWYSASSYSKELLRASDYGYQISWADLYKWSDPSFRNVHTMPSDRGGVTPIGSGPIRTGSMNGNRVVLMHEENSNSRQYVLYGWTPGRRRVAFAHPDQSVLERYFEMDVGPVTWDT
jgi:uncharacterized LabA/DUF88 family protein